MCRVDLNDCPSEFYTCDQVIARKVHRCGECGREIQIGERYERVAGKWDGEFDSHKTCLHCVVARRWLLEACDGWIFGEVFEDLLEHWKESNLYRDAFLRASIGGMSRKWRRRDGSLMDAPKREEAVQ